MIAWCWFAVTQVVTLVFTVLGWIVLLPFCIAQSWDVGAESVKPMPFRRYVDEWSWEPLNWVYSNPEDGVSGKYARLIDGSSYMPNAPAWWRAYCWSAWRNSADNLKYVFAWSDGPLVKGTWLGGRREWKLGWQTENGIKVPVASL